MENYFQLIKSESKPLTPELAKQFSEMEPSPTERDLSPARMKHLRDKADRGLLVTFNWAIAKLGDKQMRMNGQHSSALLSQMNGDMPAGLTVHLDEYSVESPEGLAMLFRQFDDRKSGRTTGDVAGAYQGLFPDLQPLPKAVAKLGVEGVAWYRRMIEGAAVPSSDDVYVMFNEPGLHPFLLWMGELFSIKTPELRRPPIAAAMYATFIKNETEARTFWDDVARGGVEFNDDAPQTVLDEWLKRAKEEKMDLKPAHYYQGSTFAWRAFREGKPITTIRFDSKKPLVEPVA